MKTKSSVAKAKLATEIPFVLIPVEDRQLVRKSGLGLQDYWLDCWEADPYGSRYILMPDADLKSTTQAKYRKQLEKLGLFMFEIRTQGGDRKLWVLNRHGSRVKGFWKGTREVIDESKQSLVSIEVQPDGIKLQLDQIEPQLDQIERSQPETQSNQGSQNPSISPQQRLNNSSSTPQRSDEEELLAFIPLEESQTTLEGSLAPECGMTEKEPLPAADEFAAPSEAGIDSSTSLSNQSEFAGDEPKDQGVDQSSATIADQSEKLNQTDSDVQVPRGFPFQIGSQITIDWPGTPHHGNAGMVKKLYLESKEVDVQFQASKTDFCFPMARVLGSTVPLPDEKPRFNPEHAQKRKARLSRLELSRRFGECPGVEFLVECWEDVVLRSQVKSLVAKYPQWGFEFP